MLFIVPLSSQMWTFNHKKKISCNPSIEFEDMTFLRDFIVCDYGTSCIHFPYLVYILIITIKFISQWTVYLSGKDPFENKGIKQVYHSYRQSIRLDILFCMFILYRLHIVL